MWSTRRVLKKDKKDLSKKRILTLSLVFGLVGIFCIGIGWVILKHEPVFVSPLPFLRSLGITGETDSSKKQIETFLKAQSISYKDITLVGKTTYVVKMENGGNAYLTSDKAIFEQLSSLQRIHSRLTMEGKKFARLDLRYDRPVIVLQ